MPRLFKTTLVFLLWITPLMLFSQVKIMTWNLKNVGSSKSEENISYIAKIIKQADVVAIQEVVTNPSGAQTILALHEELNRKSGSKWEYALSDPTLSSPYRSERYAYLWKSKHLKLKTKAFLEPTYQEEIEREPYMATFQYKDFQFTLVSLHALPKKHQPEKEIKYLKFFPTQYENKNLIFLGDFNTPESNSVFNPLKKQGYTPAFTNQKTSLRQKCINGDCLASEYDNVFLQQTLFKVKSAKAILFFEDFESIKEANKISDHIPLLIEIE
ncbi:endonuclease/exonuclease/phosphatase family protein [Myroides sp. 1354]|uniref:endonuclease/exonuclease/phosphatase family protein n=1 Tax=unclassified Myroides TaxID=2642485 RepID=UPI0025758C92|nr:MULTISPECIES: endonuclease/exonuclease/phosphatase family protein [unclassified Myroides]MDM1043467.1 endonuclease/exonuclease/phosphatase family protein [Myroides sp. R163-1]MDM1054483.1 endonuclease/exonuclease/phosphatase family protein [Myroides sp. 1354]MDM1067779.1 endonuclease/exonuclease/phosphatase family protein [Myroides sp. 1372]